MRRGTFLAMAAAPAVALGRARAQDDVDPATSSREPALRVLLGTGQAQMLSADTFSFDGRTYRGTFSRLPDGRVVNLVFLESYLYGVVAHEMSAGWPPQALSAQAICARTYVLARSDPRRSYDLVPSELGQVYDGMAAEFPAGNAAVDETAGQVLSFRGNVAQVAYSSCCGGHTESSAEAWGTTPLPYLSGVSCPYCTTSPNYRWTASIPIASIAAAFEALVAPVGTLTDVHVVARDASGRARSFELVADRGSVPVRGSTFRLAVGARNLRSLLVTDVHKDASSGEIAFTGGGLGHGVGLCQWGAHGMALAGSATAQILAFYFPGANVTDYRR